LGLGRSWRSFWLSAFDAQLVDARDRGVFMASFIEGVRERQVVVSEATLTPVTPPADRNLSEPFERVLRGVSSALDRGEALVSAAERGGYAAMDPGTLIALQAGIYRYAEAVDLTAKIVDRAANAVRTVLQGGH
jgi:hypothetical protein